ncbi:MAG: extracellular solute-binding protein, partial [Epibacterium sp.]|nr:extracellular solute-binding protein [Epibacterium sp.]NQX75573.1 extracellular solute-binding protein [Epibacterium sp.]
MKLSFTLAAVASLCASVAVAECKLNNDVPVSYLGNSFAAVKAEAAAMEECGNVTVELNSEFQDKINEALKADPALYSIVMVTNGGIVSLLNDGTLRPLNDLIDKYGASLGENQLVQYDGQVMAIATRVNNQHLMYRKDILADLGISVPKTYDEVLAAAEKIKAAGVVDYPIGGTYKSGWNLAEEFVNMYLGHGGTFIADGNKPSINNEKGVSALEIMKALTAYMDPEYLVSDSTYVQQQFQQGKIAMANLWATRAAAMHDTEESQVVGLVAMAGAPVPVEGGIPASSNWWGGWAIAKNLSDEAAAAAFQVAMEGTDAETVKSNNDLAVWLVDGYQPGELAQGVV